MEGVDGGQERVVVRGRDHGGGFLAGGGQDPGHVDALASGFHGDGAEAVDGAALELTREGDGAVE